ncbi:hypothetical protein ARMSODRAFT_899957, partial [Armillaria solidipes]
MDKDSVLILVFLFVTRAFGAQTSPDDNKGVPACIEDQRTVLGILWRCLTTIFACTWLAVHPNVPGRNVTTKGAISCAIERTKIIVVTILAPEITIAWAAEQFLVAWNLRHSECLISSGLTLAHGFLLSMGGFYYTRKYEILHQALDDRNTTSTPLSSSPPSSVHEKTIEDKSKGDALSKTFSILQISWFVVQCVARAIQHLPITLLEMTALAFAGLSMIMYLLWWYKPLNM